MSVRLTRTLAIEFANHCLSDVEYNDNQEHNFSHNLVLGTLKDGCIRYLIYFYLGGGVVLEEVVVVVVVIVMVVVVVFAVVLEW